MDLSKSIGADRMPFNTDDNKKPPFTNGVMDLTEEEILTVKERLQEVADNFVPDDYYEAVDISYLTVEYNRIYTEERINGDTCEMCITYIPKQEEPEEPVEEEQPTEEEDNIEEPVEEPVEEEPTEEV
jgi:hypothetical protein